MDKGALLKYVAAPDGSLVCDIKGKLPGRSAYLCGKKECAKLSIKKKGFTKALETEILNLDLAGLQSITLNVLKRHTFGLLNAAQGGGKLIDGSTKVMDSLRKSHLYLIIVPDDSSEDTVGGLVYAAESKGVPVISLGNKIDTAVELQRPVRAAYAVLDEKLASRVLELKVMIDTVSTWI